MYKLLPIVVATGLQCTLAGAVFNYVPIAVGVGVGDTYAMPTLFGTYYTKSEDAPAPAIDHTPEALPAKPISKPKTTTQIPDPISEAELQEFFTLVKWGNRTSTPKEAAMRNAAPPLQHALLELARDYYAKYGQKMTVNSVWRTREDQIALRAKLGRTRAVAGPDSGGHRFGLSADFSTVDAQKMEKDGLLAAHGLFIPRELTGEEWHAELVHNYTRFSKQMFSESVMMAKQGLTGAEMYKVAASKGWLSPPIKYQLVEEAATEWARVNNVNPLFAQQQAALLYYIETSGGANLISSTKIVGQMQISDKMRAKLGLRNPLSIKDSTYAALDLLKLNGLSNNILTNYARYNLGTGTYLAAKAAIRNEGSLTPNQRWAILVNIPADQRKLHSNSDDKTLVQAYNMHVKTRAFPFLESKI